MGSTYKDAGVDIEAGESAVNRIKEMVTSTYSDNVLSEVGHFGGFFRFDTESYEDPVLVSSTDGVGTKLRVAFMTGDHSTIGQDLVNHCVNDILTSGAEPLFFLDYIGIGTMEEEVVEEIVSGLTRACRQNDCALIGGEMAELPEFYQPGEYDMAGTIVGVVERSAIINGHTIQPGDIALGLPSNGLHTNGYTLARKVLLEEFSIADNLPGTDMTVGEEMLRIHRSYLREIRPLIGDERLKGLAHITGGGILGNSRRIIPEGQQLRIDWNSWELPPVFKVIRNTGDISDEEMYRTFNCGIGMVLIVRETDVRGIQDHFSKWDMDARVIGEIAAR